MASPLGEVEAAEGPFGIATGSWSLERDDWPGAVARARREGWRVLELTAIFGRLLGTLAEFLDDDPDAVTGFRRVSVHAPVGLDGEAPIADILARLPYDVVLHPDAYAGETWVAGLGGRAVFENMDVSKAFGRTVSDVGEVLAAFPAAGFCLDVAHVWTNDPSMRLGHDLLDTFGGRLRQLHVSGIEPDGSHRPTTRADLARYEPLLARCTAVPWVLEAELAEAAG